MTIRQWIACVVLGMAGVGCYPAGDDAPTGFSLRLSLSDLGITLEDSDVAAYSDWLGQKQQGLDTVFEMNNDTQKFFLGLKLFGLGAGGLPPAIQGQSVTLEVDSLEVYLSMEACQECHFEASLFWASGAGGVETFTGTSATFSLSDNLQALEMDAYLHPVGNLLCRPLLVNGAEGALVASLDVDENVQFPAVSPVLEGETWQAPMPSIPIGRTTAVMIRQMGGQFAEGFMGEETELFPSLSLDQAGQTVATACRP